MKDILTGLLIGLVPSSIVAILTAWITVKLSIRQFSSQRWWEKKADAYNEILSHLSNLDFAYQEWIDEEEEGTEYTEEHQKRLRELVTPAIQRVHTADAVGAFYVSAKAVRALHSCATTLRRPVHDGDDWYSHIIDAQASVKKAIETIRSEAKTDLNIL